MQSRGYREAFNFSEEKLKGLSEEEIEKSLDEGAKNKRENLIVDQIAFYSKTLNNQVDVTPANAIPLLFEKAQDGWYKISKPSEKPIADIILTVPDSKIKKFINSTKNAFVAYQAYSQSETAVNTGLAVGIAAGTAAIPILPLSSAAYTALDKARPIVGDFLRYSASLIMFNIMQAFGGPDGLIYDKKTIEEFWEALSANQKELIQTLAAEHFKYLVALDTQRVTDEERNNYQKLLMQGTVLLTNSIADDLKEALNNQRQESGFAKFKRNFSGLFNLHSPVSSFELQKRIFATFEKSTEVSEDALSALSIVDKRRMQEDQARWSQLKTLASNESSKRSDIEQYNISTKVFIDSAAVQKKTIFLGSAYSYMVEGNIYVDVSRASDASEDKLLYKNIKILATDAQSQLSDLSAHTANIGILIGNTEQYLQKQERDLNNLAAIHGPISSISAQSHLEFLEYKRKVRAQVLELVHLLAKSEQQPDQKILDQLRTFYIETLQGDGIDFKHAREYKIQNENESQQLAQKLLEKSNSTPLLLIGTSNYWQQSQSDPKDVFSQLIAKKNAEKTNQQIEGSKGEYISPKDITTIITNTKKFLLSLKNTPDLYNLYRSIIAQEIASLSLSSAADPLLISALDKFREELGIPRRYFDDLAYASTSIKQNLQDTIPANTRLDLFSRAAANQSADEIYRLKLISQLISAESTQKRFDTLDEAAEHNQAVKAFTSFKRLISDIDHNVIDQVANRAKGMLPSDNEKLRLNTVSLIDDDKSIVYAIANTFTAGITSYAAFKGVKSITQTGMEKMAAQAGGLAPFVGVQVSGIAQGVANKVAKPIANMVGFLGGIVSYQIYQARSNKEKNVNYTTEEAKKIFNALPINVQKQIAIINDIYLRYLALLDKKTTSPSDNELISIRRELGNAIIILSTMTTKEQKEQAENLEDKRSPGQKIKSTLKSWLNLIPGESKISPGDLQSTLYTALGDLAGNATTLVRNNPWAKFWHGVGKTLRNRGATKFVDAVSKIYDRSVIVNFFSPLQIERLSPDKRKILHQEKKDWERAAQDAEAYQLLQPKPEEYLKTLQTFNDSRSSKKILLGAESAYYIAYMEHATIPNDKNLEKLKEESIKLTEAAKAQFVTLSKPENAGEIAEYIKDTGEYIESLKSGNTQDFSEYQNRLRVQVLQLVQELSKNPGLETAIKELEKFYTGKLQGDPSDITFAQTPVDQVYIQQNALADILYQKSKNKGSPILLGSSELWSTLLPENNDYQTLIRKKRFESTEIDKILENTKQVLNELKQGNPELYRTYRDFIAKQIAELSRDRSLDPVANMSLDKFWKEVLGLPLNFKDDLDLLLYTSQQNLQYATLYLRAVTTEQPQNNNNAQLLSTTTANIILKTTQNGPIVSEQQADKKGNNPVPPVVPPVPPVVPVVPPVPPVTEEKRPTMGMKK